tara:strand:+ start:355 stop:552 length:198 start_codon:yes stop_codon:yes gene_type:complete
MSNFTRIGACSLGIVYSHDYSWRVVVVTPAGEQLGADAGDFSRFWFCDTSHALIDGDTGRAYEVN